GTAVLATIVTKREQFHSNIIGQAVDLGREEVRNRIAEMTDYFMAHGMTDPTGARQQAIIALGNAVKRQALVLVFSDTFAVIGIVLITAGIAVLLTGKPKTQAAGLLTRGAPHALATNDQVPKSRRELKTRLSGIVPLKRKSDLAAEAARLERSRDLGAE